MPKKKAALLLPMLLLVITLFGVSLFLPEFIGSTWAQAADPKPGVSKIPSVNKLNTGIQAAKEGNANSRDFGSKMLDTNVTAFACILAGKGPSSSLKCDDDEDEITTSTPRTLNDNGAIGTFVSFIGDMYQNPPANTQTYVADIMQDLRLGVAQPAYAQGIGFASLSPILSVWKILRNIAYFFFVIIFVVIGFMIMFRQKISSQAVVTAQQALPSIIIALITVTFSYAIAGLLIDLMYLFMFLIAGVFGKVSLIDGNVFQITKRLIDSNAAGTGANALGIFIENSLGGGIAGSLGKVITTIGAAVILLLVIVFNMFKLFITLLRTYIEIILNIVFAPLILMMGAIPGKNPFKQWVMNIVGNLAVFPTILIMIIIYESIRDASGVVQGGFQPPYLAGFTDPDALAFLAGLAMILALPEAVDQIKKAMGVSSGGMFATLIEAGVKKGWEGRKYPSRIAAAQPFSLPNMLREGTPLRTSGTETTLERWLAGSRSDRKAEYRERDRIAALGGNYVPKAGGLLGPIINSRLERGAAQRQAGGGAGADQE